MWEAGLEALPVPVECLRLSQTNRWKYSLSYQIRSHISLLFWTFLFHFAVQHLNRISLWSQTFVILFYQNIFTVELTKSEVGAKKAYFRYWRRRNILHALICHTGYRIWPFLCFTAKMCNSNSGTVFSVRQFLIKLKKISIIDILFACIYSCVVVWVLCTELHIITDMPGAL